LEHGAAAVDSLLDAIGEAGLPLVMVRVSPVNLSLTGDGESLPANLTLTGDGESLPGEPQSHW